MAETKTQESLVRSSEPQCTLFLEEIFKVQSSNIHCLTCEELGFRCLVSNHPRSHNQISTTFSSNQQAIVVHQGSTQFHNAQAANLNTFTDTASQIVNHSPHKYDIFAQVCGANTYVPNILIQTMIDYDLSQQSSKVLQCESNLEGSLQYVDTFRIVQKDSESLVMNPNLKTLLLAMANISEKRLIFLSDPKLTYSHLAKSVHAEPCLLFEQKDLPPIIIGAEVNGIEASIRQCYPQLIAVCGSSCVEMKRLGAQKEDCVIFGVAMAGSLCQFCAVYLLDECFPVLTALSPELSLIGSFAEIRILSEWCVRLVTFSLIVRSRLQSSIYSQGELKVCLNLVRYFVKPVRNRPKESIIYCNRDNEPFVAFSTMNITLNRIMRVYELLRKNGGTQSVSVKSVILFPEGVVSIPDKTVNECQNLRKLLIESCKMNGFHPGNFNYRPVILFPLLSTKQGWRHTKPEEPLKSKYLELVVNAIEVLNKGGVAHLDLRTDNIMWRSKWLSSSSSSSSMCSSSSIEMELRIIDFEYAVAFGYVIPQDFVEKVLYHNDPRYPFFPGDEKTVQIAGAVHNDFYLNAITHWLESHELNFDDFMIKQNLKKLRTE